MFGEVLRIVGIVLLATALMGLAVLALDYAFKFSPVAGLVVMAILGGMVWVIGIFCKD